MFRVTTTLCASLAIVLVMAGQVQAQTSTGTTTGTSTGGLTSTQINQLLQLLQSGAGSSLLSSLTGGTTGTTGTTGTSGTSSTTATSQPSGPPKNFIQAGIARHDAFYANAFGKTPAERRAATSQPAANTTKIPLTLVVQLLANWLGDRIPALAFLANLFGNLTPNTNPSGPTPPPAKSGEGIVAFATADDTSLNVGDTTTARLWVQQSSPNTAKDNGIFSVAVNVDASVVGVIESTVPVTLVSPFENPGVGGTHTGTVTQTGGIGEVTAGVSITSQDKSEGTSGPVEVFNWKIDAVGAGTVTLTPTNFVGSGFKGILDWGSETGDESNYVSVTITVK